MAFSLNLTWQAPNANALLDDGYDQWVIEKESPATVWAAIAPLQVMPIITKDMLQYVFNGSTGDVAVVGVFRARAYDSVNQVYEATPITVTAALAGYCSIDDIREQGYAIGTYPDAKVQSAIQRTTSIIDKLCRQWFEPRYKRVSLDAKRIDQLWVKIPIIAIQEAKIDEEVLDLDEFEIYNRHLTHGIVNPDDRADPRIAWGDGREPIDVRRLYGGGRFPKARKSVICRGVFGYTDVGPEGYVGETADRSQIPITFGVTPEAIKQAATKLTLKYMLTFEDAQDLLKAGKVIEEKTRDQSYKLASPSTADASYGLTGDTEVDNILVMYQAPFDIGVV